VTGTDFQEFNTRWDCNRKIF